ncbi:hypothetical protein L3Y34_013610 [Caenorhabditis briggsae]|uniref:Protein kinase domain-containing protein n=1 Tax=Caenorhabditis briggsae TaxID=6238 RepID=A0AAE8ZS29_CAEBR|nr:hypothetical protein L3Y34_013610 [Caenorhabditis briggsae]
MTGHVSLLTLSGTQIKGYHLSQLIGSGAYGAVYRGTCGSDVIALKVSHREHDLAIEAKALQLLNSSDVSPKIFFSHHDGIYHTLGLQLLGLDLETLREKGSSKPFDRHTLVKFMYQAIACLEAVHEMRIVHRDIKLANFAVTVPTNPGNRVALRILDFGLSHLYEDNNGTPLDDSRSVNFKRMKYCSYAVSIGCTPLPKDDIVQISYAVLHASDFDFAGKLKCPARELLTWKEELASRKKQSINKYCYFQLSKPAEALPHSLKFMFPFFEIVGELDDDSPIDYSLTKQRIQECLPGSDATGDLLLSEKNGELLLV